MSEEIGQVLDASSRPPGTSPPGVSLFPSLSSAFVQARPDYLKTLLEQGEVLGAMLNASPQPK